MTPSTRTKNVIKTGLAMAIAYGISLQMDWDRPYWAAFAVAFLSLPAAGQSLHKGTLRMFGTLVAGVAEEKNLNFCSPQLTVIFARALVVENSRS